MKRKKSRSLFQIINTTPFRWSRISLTLDICHIEGVAARQRVDHDLTQLPLHYLTQFPLSLQSPLSLSLVLLQVNLRDVLLAACLIDWSWSRRRSRNCWNRCQIVQHFVLLSFFVLFFFWVFIYFSMCASPVVLLLSFVFFCCGSLTVRFRVSVKYFRLAPDDGNSFVDFTTRECISISGLSICKSCKRKGERKWVGKSGRERQQGDKTQRVASAEQSYGET